jgi:transcriptional regulator with XRE-family HTH domain
MDDTMLATLIKERMKERGLSLRKAAEEIGVSHPTLARILDGEPYTIETAQKLANWLGVPVADFIGPATGTPNDVAQSLASILAQEPKLMAVFTEAIERVNNGRMKPETLRELLAYAAFRLGQEENAGDGTG